jgi:hypothetical protein
VTWWSLPSGSRHEPHDGSGAPGTAYGLVCTSALLAVGAPPALASASVHATEVVTTGLSGGSQLRHRNVDWGAVPPPRSGRRRRRRARAVHAGQAARGRGRGCWWPKNANFQGKLERAKGSEPSAPTLGRLGSIGAASRPPNSGTRAATDRSCASKESDKPEANCTSGSCAWRAPTAAVGPLIFHQSPETISGERSGSGQSTCLMLKPR